MWVKEFLQSLSYKMIMDLNRQKLLSQLREIDGYNFEHLIADLWEQRGWETTVTTKSNDRGIDVIAEKSSPFSQKHLVQAKKYSAGNKIGGPAIQQYSSLRYQENDVDAVVIVTTSSFTSQARQRADELNVKLIDGDDLCDLIFGLDSQTVLYDYLLETEARNTNSDFNTNAGKQSLNTNNTSKSNSSPSFSNIPDRKLAEREPEEHYNKIRDIDREGTGETFSIPQEYVNKTRKSRQIISIPIIISLFFGSLFLFTRILDIWIVIAFVVSFGVSLVGLILYGLVSYKIIETMYHIQNETK
jgi:hypothetical protein